VVVVLFGGFMIVWGLVDDLWVVVLCLYFELVVVLFVLMGWLVMY